MSYIHNSIKENQEFLRKYDKAVYNELKRFEKEDVPLITNALLSIKSQSQKLKNLTEKEQGDGK